MDILFQITTSQSPFTAHTYVKPFQDAMSDTSLPGQLSVLTVSDSSRFISTVSFRGVFPGI
jgi:hypothetical protein